MLLPAQRAEVAAVKPALPGEVARLTNTLMAGFGAPWCIAGGWAIDLFLGRVTRPHADVELAVFREDQWRLHRHFEGWALTVAVGGRREPWERGVALELPVHEIHARSAHEPGQSIELLLNERDGGNWVFRRNPEIVLPLERAMVDTASGVQALSPEVVLLFKAKSRRPKDEDDFHRACSALPGPSRRWLRSALRTCHGDHPWIPLLDDSV